MAQMDEKAVWQRVSGGDPPGPAPAGPELLDLMAEKEATAALCRRLLSRANARQRPTLQRILSTLRRQIRTLSALSRYLTGERPKPPRRAGPPSGQSSLSDLLRALERSAGQLEALSARFSGEVRETLQQMAREDRRMFRQVLAIMA